ncbi:MAG: flavin reductase family protein [Coriobacteriales bacterium]|jgi:flavin reductase (DIM6/NTAB) family NADH-FMN oxidoreductase RutF|nr:flavin reductase family protein [Coriobacteriales bacterium]
MTFRAIDPNDLNLNPFTGIGKQWMLVTAAKPDGSVNAMTAAWGGLGFIWQQPVAFVFIRPQRCTKTFVEASPTFSLSFFASEYRDALSFMGNVSGFDDPLKVEHSGLTLAYDPDDPLATPYFAEAHTVLIVERLYEQDMAGALFIDQTQVERWYPQADFHTLYIAGIKKVLVA